ncbi:MAG: membrane protein insertion efficiency factor YidD, partial [Mariprofundus sp.]|nr:membrane protein insertion efficiency factor YidD [Mariprofundus sp.]
MSHSFFALYGLLASASFAFALLWQALLPPVSGPQNVLMHFYRFGIGQMDGRSCPSYPVCSLYASQAVKQHGLLLGSWLAMDRIIHEHDDIQDGHWLSVNGEKRLYDPLARNDFWL